MHFVCYNLVQYLKRALPINIIYDILLFHLLVKIEIQITLVTILAYELIFYSYLISFKDFDMKLKFGLGRFICPLATSHIQIKQYSKNHKIT